MYLTESVYVDPEEVAWALAHIPLRKKVSSGSAAGALYRACRQVLTPKVHAWLCHLWQPGPLRLADRWVRAELIFLPKPDKKTSEVKDWRPIGLQCPLAKAMMHILVHKASPFISAWAAQYSVHAYIAGRSTKSALAVVFQHCDAIRQLCERNQDNLHRRFTGWTPPDLTGGLQVCLDLTSAFDLVPWRHIEEALCLTQMPEGLRQVLMGWLQASKYDIRINDHKQSVDIQRGVKQGCRASPMLFLAYMCLVCLRVDSKLGPGWCQSHLTIYADDTHARWQIESPRSLDQAMFELGALMQTLEDMGMTLNDSKAKALLTLRGLKYQACRKKWSTRHKNRPLLKFVHGEASRSIPLVQHCEYLGAIISYDNYETRTVRHRLQKARTRYWQLQKLLSTRRGMRVAQRLQMWQATIKPTLLYGLECLPLSSALRHEVTSFAMKHIRAIAANQSHITHTSDAELLQQHKVCSISDSLLSAIRRNSTTLEQYPVSDMTEWGHRCLDAFQAACVNMTAVQRQFDPHACPICGVYFDSRRAVKVHIARAHPSRQTGPEAESSIPTPPIPLPAESAITEPVSGTASSISSSQNVSACQARVDSARFSCSATPAKQIILVHDAASTGVDGDTPADRTLLTAGTVTHGQPVVFCKATHSKNGVPTCAACHKNFGRWSGLCKHLTKGYCPAMFSLKSGQAITPAPDFLPVVRRPDVIAVVLSRGLSGLNHLPALLEEMKQRCVLCHQWVASSWMMKNHFRNTHADFWQENHALCDKYCKDQGVCSLRCNYCGKYTRERGNALAHMKRCTVLWQAAVLHFALQMEVPADPAAQVEEFFGKVLESAPKRTRMDEEGTPQPRRGKGGPRGTRALRKAGTGPVEHGQRDLLVNMSRLLIAHEDAIQTLRQDTAFVWFLKCEAPTIVPDLFRAAEAWRIEAGKPTPTVVGRKPLRDMLFLTILKHLSTNLKNWQKDTVHQETSKKQGWVTAEGHWQFQKWCPDTRTLIVDNSRPALTTQTILDTLSDMMEDVLKETLINRFHSTRKLAADSTGVVAMIMDVSLRRELGGKMYWRLQTLQANTACVADFRHPIQTRILAQISPGRANPAHGLQQQILRAVYHNSCNHCYLNAWVRALASASIAVFGDTRALGSFRECIMQYHEPGALVNGQVRLMQPAFRALLECWPQPDAQNDIFEFAAHFMQAAGAIQVFGEWQHRDVHAGSLRVRDRGHVVSFYLRGHASHTALWTQWRSQDAHAFISPPRITLAQVMRFQPDGAGRLRRRTGCVTHLAAEVDVPIFAERSTSVLHHPYRPCAILLHSGHTPTSGHYRCAVMGTECVHLCDDNHESRRLSALTSEHMKLVYGILYTPVA